MPGAVVPPEKTSGVTENPQVKRAGVWKKGFRLLGRSSSALAGCPLTSGDLK